MSNKHATWLDVVKETVIFLTAIVVAIATGIMLDKMNAGKKERALIEARTQKEHELALRQERKEARERAEKKEIERRMEVRERERLKELERERAEQKATESRRLRGLASRYDAVVKALLNGRLIYWRNASASERNVRQNEEAVYMCYVSNRRAKEAVVEMRVSPSNDVCCVRWSRDADPVPMTKDDFDILVGDSPYLSMRFQKDIPMSPAFLSFPNRNVGELYGVPSQGGEFNPAAIEFGDFLSCLTGPTLLHRAKFSFVVYFHENGRVEGEPMGEVDLDGSVDYMTFYNFVEKKLFDRKYEAEERRLMASAPRRAKSTGEGLVNHSTISKTTLDGKFTPGEFHGTRVSYVDLTPEPRRYDRALHRWRAKRAQEHVRGRHHPPPPRPAVRPVRPIYNCAWTPSHFVSPGSYSYMPKVYTHWKESSAYLDNEKIQRSAGKDVDALEPDLSKICITRKEVEGVLSKSKVSFKVVE